MTYTASCQKLKTKSIFVLDIKLEEPSPMILQFLKPEIKSFLVLQLLQANNLFTKAEKCLK